MSELEKEVRAYLDYYDMPNEIARIEPIDGIRYEVYVFRSYDNAERRVGTWNIMTKKFDEMER